ncbi:L,D-transpeptidase family protein [Parasulfitobacter algicola]|uniref:L,D-transpeptidase family protein n=1 Tax=Parasulfitobacter algicola TaxID=2614809 RepID=A0ABX2IR27_9RHOB|nr:L,D-transpeptidase family protein [Sulfitobacter algicola]NSX55347.1 L,D-transpeptidase family protein [Sulfitobacter algicola]
MLISQPRPSSIFAIIALLFVVLTGIPAASQNLQARQALAEAAASDRGIAEFYKSRNYEPIWTGSSSKDRQRRQSFLKALKTADDHGLPAESYKADTILSNLRGAKTVRERAQIEVQLSKMFLDYARDIQTGVLVPSRVDSGIVRKIPYRDRTATLTAFSKSSANGFIKSLPPRNPEYTRLMKEKMRLERLLARGGWGPEVRARELKPGATGAQVVALRDRLRAMGYIRRSSTQTYDDNIRKAVALFQRDHGLRTDGVAGKGTMSEINKPVEARLQSVIVAMERERWMNMDRGKRHVMVNLTDFTAKIIDNNKVTFSTRSVIGKNVDDQRSPEFSDTMEFMVINPSWYVPRSIATKEYLPLLRRNPNAVRHLEIRDTRGRRVNRATADFANYTENNFPYTMREPPSQGNALGLVKFMFPNQYNIYLHDTPAKNLFNRETRAYSHGCIRLRDPFDFAYALLAKQTNDPEGFFKAQLRTGKEVQVDLKQPVPVHIMYRTAFTQAKGPINFRRDVYGRDARIWRALEREGVALRAVRG